jgi:hypothetical protein
MNIIREKRMWVNSWIYSQHVKESKSKRTQWSILKDKLVRDKVIILSQSIWSYGRDGQMYGRFES